MTVRDRWTVEEDSGRGGAPAIAAGAISALNQTVTVSDSVAGTAEKLTGLIQVAANVQPGDSGGPLVNSAGQDTAGSAGSRSRFRWRADATGGNAASYSYLRASMGCNRAAR